MQAVEPTRARRVALTLLALNGFAAMGIGVLGLFGGAGARPFRWALFGFVVATSIALWLVTGRSLGSSTVNGSPNRPT